MPDALRPPPHPADTLDRCAELSALLDDPFADRPAVLRAAGLDEETWVRIQERWSAALAAAEGDAMVARYGEVYETTLRRLSSGGAPTGPTPDTDREGPRFLSVEARPWRAEAAAVEASGVGVAPTLRSSPSPQLPPPPPSPPVPPAAPPLAATLDMDAAELAVPALPFVLPARPASTVADTLDMDEALPLPATPFERKP